ncbi:MAG: aminomethyltransferase family protein, partial [Candidatus Competibacteraceae bacterium]|nr:aminomethyltransferase family protein [Candidatus Competibacteraceae bacterium]
AMAGGPGYEFWGPWDEGKAVSDAILEAGREFDLRQVGAFAYFSTALEVGWIPRPVHAIYTSEEMRCFREWLPADANEVKWSLGGSFYSPNIEDYYFNPYELGYGYHVKFDHDFIGREALEKIAGDKHRKRVSLMWNAEDVNAVTASYMDKQQLPGLYINHPISNYANWQYDKVVDGSDNTVGLAVYTGFNWNYKSMLSTAVVDADHAVPGTEVTVIWGEPDNGAKSHPWIEPHRQMRVRATVVEAPLNNVT